MAESHITPRWLRTQDPRHVSVQELFKLTVPINVQQPIGACNPTGIVQISKLSTLHV